MTDAHLDWWPLNEGGPFMREPPPDPRRINPAEIASLRTLILDKNWTGHGTHLAILRRIYAARDHKDPRYACVPTWGPDPIKAGQPDWIRDRRRESIGAYYVTTSVVAPADYTNSLDEALRLLQSVLPGSHYILRTDDDGAEAEIVTDGSPEGRTRAKTAPIAVVCAVLAVLIADPGRAAPRWEP